MRSGMLSEAKLRRPRESSTQSGHLRWGQAPDPWLALRATRIGPCPADDGLGYQLAAVIAPQWRCGHWVSPQGPHEMPATQRPLIRAPSFRKE